MHHLISFVLILGFCFLLIVGFLSVLQELMDRDLNASAFMNERDLLEHHPGVGASEQDPTAEMIEQRSSLHLPSGRRAEESGF
jgi:hypothetical protein